VLLCVAVCCSVLQCVAVCCSVVQCVAVCYRVLQCVTVRCSALQCVAVCYSVLQCVAVCGSVCQYDYTYRDIPFIDKFFSRQISREVPIQDFFLMQTIPSQRHSHTGLVLFRKTFALYGVASVSRID